MQTLEIKSIGQWLGEEAVLYQQKRERGSFIDELLVKTSHSFEI